MSSAEQKAKFLFRYSIQSLAGVILLALFLRLLVFSSYAMSTTSMVPTVLAGEFIIALKWPYGLSLPLLGPIHFAELQLKRGDVVVYQCSEDGELICLRRVMALPGDRLELREGMLTLNGLAADYKTRPDGAGVIETWKTMRQNVVLGTENLSPVVVPPEHLFVMSDNRSQVADGHLIPVKTLEAKAWRIWMSLDWFAEGSTSQWPRIRWHRMLHSID